MDISKMNDHVSKIPAPLHMQSWLLP
uniref:Uncharacterized protein n=1 Tax=Arundo donax TaxID=35708 RepID=A0A0A9B151_ARUDO